MIHGSKEESKHSGQAWRNRGTGNKGYTVEVSGINSSRWDELNSKTGPELET